MTETYYLIDRTDDDYVVIEDDVYFVETDDELERVTNLLAELGEPSAVVWRGFGPDAIATDLKVFAALNGDV